MNIAITRGAFSNNIKNIFSGALKQNTIIIPQAKSENINLNEFDLFVFSGGTDISPWIYKERNRNCYFVDENRDIFEIRLLKYVLKNNKKVFGICRGHQLINAVLGGSLYQDLSEINNLNHISNHEIIEINNGIVPRNFKFTNSLHHQAVKKIGELLTATTVYKGCIESTENEQIITVQFHPEIMPYNKRFFKDILNWAKISQKSLYDKWN